MEDDEEVQGELKKLRKQLYTYQNKLLEIERQSILAREEYEYRFCNKRRKLVDVKDTFAESFSPLRNEYILEMIANYLPSQSLKNCRGVCRLWNKEMVRCLNARKTLIVTENDCPDALELSKKAGKTALVPVGSLCFFDVANTPLYKKLMKAYGWTLSGLKLEECKLTYVDLAEIFTRLAPNLESFYYKDRAPKEAQRLSTFSSIKSHLNGRFCIPDLKRLQWDEEFGKVDLEEIISACPNLLELCYKNAPIPIIENYKKLRWNTLIGLKFSPRDELRVEHLIALSSLKLKLRRLTVFGVTTTKVRMNNLRKLLKSVATTLEDLEIFHHHSIVSRYNSDFESPFPVSLPHLSRLNIDFGILRTTAALNCLPNLKIFQCKAVSSKDWEAVFKIGRPLLNENLVHLTLGSINKKCLLKFSQCFPKVTNLEVYPCDIDDDAMSVIILGFPILEQLRISKMASSPKLKLTDSAFTGVFFEDCHQNNRKSNSSKKHSGISDLKNLTRLEIHGEASSLTDGFMINGIAKCSKLTMLGLPKCNNTDASLLAIQKNLRLTLLDLPNPTDFSETALKLLRSSHKDMLIQSGLLQGFYRRNLTI